MMETAIEKSGSELEGKEVISWVFWSALLSFHVPESLQA